MKRACGALRAALAALALPLVALPAAAFAQETADAADPLAVDLVLGASSDYRFRGITLSGSDPTLNAELILAHESGVYGSLFATNSDADFDDKGNDAELDWVIGYAEDLGPVNLDVGVLYYSFVNRSNLNTLEIFGGLEVPVGDATVTLGAAYSPRQDSTGGLDNTYIYLAGELPIRDTRFTLIGNFGIEDGAYGDRKRDWLLGVRYDLGLGLAASLDYVDSHRAFSPLGKATLVASLTKSF